MPNYYRSPVPGRKAYNYCLTNVATDFFTRCCKSVKSTAARCFLALLLVVIALLGDAPASELSVRNASLTPSKQGYVFNADFVIDLNHTLEEALERGVVLFFVVESRIWRPRWWWFNETISSIEETRKLSYNSLTRQYRLSWGNSYQNFSSLDDAESSLAQLRNQIALEPSALSKENPYRASVRMWLDVTQLPKPFQVKAVTAAEWKLDSNEWVFDVTF
jgi:Domain of unknown function (DUF4390)